MRLQIAFAYLPHRIVPNVCFSWKKNTMDEREILDRWFKRIKADRWARRHQFTEKEFENHVRAIGQLVLAWNDFHERLAPLFVFVLGAGWVNRPLALWHSTRTDQSKRNMLKAVLDHVPPSEVGSRDKMIAEIKWLLGKAQPIEGTRDDAVHTPLYYYPPLSPDNMLASIIQTGIFADDAWGNERAWRINREGKDLVAEFEHARQRIILLRDYAMALDLAWGNERLPWPDRPVLPNPPPKTAKKRRSAGRKSK
jgi:hypothetical protein